MPEIKHLAWSAITGALAIVGTLFVTSLFESAEDGADALERQRIESIVDAKIAAALTVTINVLVQGKYD